MAAACIYISHDRAVRSTLLTERRIVASSKHHQIKDDAQRDKLQEPRPVATADGENKCAKAQRCNIVEHKEVSPTERAMVPSNGKQQRLLNTAHQNVVEMLLFDSA
jgi:hypothetical protein